MPSFITSEMEKVNVKFIELVKQYPCIWNRDAPNYNEKPHIYKAWDDISQKTGDTTKDCIKHWQKLRSAYVKSFKLNTFGSCQKSEYYLSSALEFVRPHLNPGCPFSRKKDDPIIDVEDSGSSMNEIDIKEEPEDSDGGASATSTSNFDKVIFDIIKIESDVEDQGEEPYPKSDVASSSCNKRKSETNSNEASKTKEAKEADNDGPVSPNACLIEANRKFFESLIPFIDEMNNQQNRRFRREIMCLIDDVLDDRDINEGK